MVESNRNGSSGLVPVLSEGRTARRQRKNENSVEAVIVINYTKSSAENERKVTG
jgi:hypothetical protein